MSTSYSSFLPGYAATFGGGPNDQLYYAAGDGTELQYTVRIFLIFVLVINDSGSCHLFSS